MNFSFMDSRQMKKPTGRKRTNRMRNNQLDVIHVLSCRGFTQSQIGAKLGLSQSQICRDLETINQLMSPQNATEKAKIGRLAGLGGASSGGPNQNRRV